MEINSPGGPKRSFIAECRPSSRVAQAAIGKRAVGVTVSITAVDICICEGFQRGTYIRNIDNCVVCHSDVDAEGGEGDDN